MRNARGKRSLSAIKVSFQREMVTLWINMSSQLKYLQKRPSTERKKIQDQRILIKTLKTWNPFYKSKKQRILQFLCNSTEQTENTQRCTNRQINGNNLKFWESTNQLLTAAVKPSPPFPPDETCLYPRIHEFFVEPLQRLVVPMHPPATKADDTEWHKRWPSFPPNHISFEY